MQGINRGGDENFRFRFQFHVHKALGSMEIGDMDQKLLAAVYGVREADVEAELLHLRNQTELFAAKLRNKFDLSKLDQVRGKKILFLGDSNTSNRQSYYNIIRVALEDYKNITMKDLSISAQKAIDLFTAMYPTTIGEHADLAHIMIGTNDVRRIDNRRDVFFTSPKEFQKNLDYIIWSLKENGTQVIVSTIPPISRTRTDIQYDGYHTVYLEEDRLLFNDILKKTAEKYGAIVNQMEPVYAPYTAEELTMTDGIHLNEFGHEILAEQLLYVLLDEITDI